MERMPAGIGEEIAEESLRRALEDRCLGGSWRGLMRGLAWRVVSAGGREPRSIELLAEAAEAMFASLIDEAVWAVECRVAQAWQEFLAARPGDRPGALTAARLDAAEESARLVDSACDRVLQALLAGSRRAA
jgi:hypothetical protein